MCSRTKQKKKVLIKILFFCEIIAMTKLICMQEYDSIGAFRSKNSCNNKTEHVTVMK